MAAKLTIQSRDSNSKLINENFKISDSYELPDSDTAVIIDTFARGIVNLTTNTYQDSVVTRTQSINEILAE